MSCTLTIENVSSLASGDPVVMTLNEHGLSIGRAPHADWTLPDPRNFISSMHADIEFSDGQYVLIDRSTNGTFINGDNNRPTAPYTLRDGDLLRVGSYDVRVSLGGGGFAASTGQGAAPSGGLDWMVGASGASAPTRPDEFGREARRALFQSNNDPMMADFAPPATLSAPQDPFGIAAHIPSAPVSADPFGLTGPAAPPVPAFSAPASPDPFGIASPAPTAPAAAPTPAADNPWAKLHAFDAIDFATAATPTAPPAPAPARTPEAPDGGAAFARFLAAAGLKPADVEGVPPSEVLEAAGHLLRQTADGLIRLLDARTRVRHQFGVGAQVTSFQTQGNNPLKWTRQPEQALRQMVGRPDGGFLTGQQAVHGAFQDLQAHEVAMLAAMQEALAATVQRFSPDAIKSRAKARSGLLPGAREATLWRAFETEYQALAAESDAAFLDLFARHFRTAYERNVKKD
ncbi:phosphopeptide-binding protein [Polymorphobacter multimanifer]|uniref:Type VI secretion system FHA domain protein n=1 Tax=Polymorphobacter multimanifer TaxID=1070431 RepID=A0A841L5B2_9SPHN|nr:type VI secretion system-associated FHA domain protein TagH [Polymorphobacter multimanifer]MBB6227456.1 type VI secretion system FHA domain protein [Polymorphobacter multimanifer]GGI68110.1 phosphopeptide-binding protein [Polymorphobacter multimanifer]